MSSSWEGRTVRGAIPGRAGGLSRSRAKAQASRENGKLGGRPKNKTKLALANERLRELEEQARAATARAEAAEALLAASKPKAEPPPDFTKGRFGLLDLD